MFLYKLMFFMSLFLGTLITISSYNWMSMWMGLEINLLSIIPLMKSSNNMLAAEASLKYFIVQTLASTMLLFSIISLSTNFIYNIDMKFSMNFMLNSAILMKMGAAPFHFWFPEIIEGLTWLNTFIMLTWQKIAPMIIFMYSNTFFLMNLIIIISCMIISGIFGLNQISLRKILAFSSINHIGWMIAAMMFNETIWKYYFIIYTIISFNLIIIFYKLNIFYLKNLLIYLNNQFMIKMLFNLNFLSLGGIPPFLGFMPKWLTIQTLIQNNFYLLTIFMLILTLMTLYIYMRITMMTFSLFINEINFNIKNKLNYNWIMTINLISILGLLFCTLMFNFI